MPGEYITVSIPPEIRVSCEQTLLSDSFFDYPLFSLEVCLESLSQHVKPLLLGHSTIMNMKVIGTQLHYCYHIDVDSTFEYRSVSWNSTPQNRLFDMGYTISPVSFAWDFPPQSRSAETIVQQSIQSRKCEQCDGGSCYDGSVESCNVCGGCGVLCDYLTLRIDQQTGSFSRFVNTCQLPSKCVKRCKGLLSVHVTGGELVLDNPFLDKVLNQETEKLLDDIREWSEVNEVVTRKQSLYISVIPVREIICTLYGFTLDLLVYDQDRKIFCKKISRC